MIYPKLLYEYDKKILLKKVPEDKTLRARVLYVKLVVDHYPKHITKEK